MSLFDRLFRRIAQANLAEADQGPPVFDEIATAMDGRDITIGYIDSLPLLPNLDSVLGAKGVGNLQLYEQLYSDEQIKLCFDQRQLGLISKDWYVEPGGTMRADKKAAALVEEALKNVSWDEVTRKMLMGVFFGYGIAEAMWARDGATVTLDALKVRRQRRFGFAPDGSLRLLTMHDPLGEVLPPRKFWAFATGALDDDNPYGRGLAHWLYWPVWFKRNVTKFWLVYLEKFGMPTVVGKYSPGISPTEKTKLLSAAQAVHRSSAVTIPDSMMIELVEATRSSGADYSEFWDRMNQIISKIIVGQTFSTEGHGGQYKGDNLMQVREDLIKADADLINNSFSQTVATWLTDWNYPGAAVPKVWRRVDNEPDLLRTSETQRNVFVMGYRPTLASVQETYGGDWETSPVPPDPSATQNPIGDSPADGSSTDLAEGDEPDTVDRQVERLGREAEPLVGKLLDPVRKLLAESSDLSEVQRKIGGLYGDMDASDLAELLGQAIAAAELAGRYELDQNEGL